MILNDVHNFELQSDDDVILWKFEANQKFSVKSFYNAFTRNDVGLIR